MRRASTLLMITVLVVVLAAPLLEARTVRSIEVQHPLTGFVFKFFPTGDISIFDPATGVSVNLDFRLKGAKLNSTVRLERVGNKVIWEVELVKGKRDQGWARFVWSFSSVMPAVKWSVEGYAPKRTTFEWRIDAKGKEFKQKLHRVEVARFVFAWDDAVKHGKLPSCAKAKGKWLVRWTVEGNFDIDPTVTSTEGYAETQGFTAYFNSTLPETNVTRFDVSDNTLESRVGEYWYGEVFTISERVAISAIEVHIAEQATTSYGLEVNLTRTSGGYPSETIAYWVIDNGTVGTALTWVRLDLPSATELEAGDYAIIMSIAAPAGTDVGAGNGWLLAYDSALSYADGYGVESYDNGATWKTSTVLETNFAVIGWLEDEEWYLIEGYYWAYSDDNATYRFDVLNYEIPAGGIFPELNILLPKGYDLINVTAQYPPTYKVYDPETGTYEEFTHKIPIVINNTAGGALTDYQRWFNVTYQANMVSDFSDIRFAIWNATSQRYERIPAWNETQVDGSWCYCWVRIPEIAAGTYYDVANTTLFLFYGNATNVNPYWDPAAVFDFFDDFDDGAIDTSKWEPDGDVSESGGVLYVPDGSSVNTTITFSPPVIVGARVRLAGACVGFALWPPEGAANQEVADYHDSNTDWEFITKDTSTTYTITTIQVDADTANYHRDEMWWTSTKASLYRDGALAVTHTTNIPVDPAEIWFATWGANYVGDVYVDYVYVRKYADPEPTATIEYAYAESASGTGDPVLLTAGTDYVEQDYNATHFSLVILSDALESGANYTVFAQAFNAVVDVSTEYDRVYFLLSETFNVTAVLKDPYGDPIAGQEVDFWINETLVATATSDAQGYATVSVSAPAYDSLFYVCANTSGLYAGLRNTSALISTDINYSVTCPDIAQKNVAFDITVEAWITYDSSPVDTITVNGSTSAGGSVTISVNITLSGHHNVTLELSFDKGGAAKSDSWLKTVFVGGSVNWNVTFDPDRYRYTGQTCDISIDVTYDTGERVAQTVYLYLDDSLVASGAPILTHSFTMPDRDVSVLANLTDIDGAVYNYTATVFWFNAIQSIGIPRSVFLLSESVTVNVTLADPHGDPISGQEVTFWVNDTVVGSAFTDASGVAQITITVPSADSLFYIKANSTDASFTYAGEIISSDLIATDIAYSVDCPDIAQKNVAFNVTVEAWITYNGTPVDSIVANGTTYSGGTATLTLNITLSGHHNISLSLAFDKGGAVKSDSWLKEIFVGGSVNWAVTIDPEQYYYPSGTSVSISVDVTYDTGERVSQALYLYLNDQLNATGSPVLSYSFTMPDVNVVILVNFTDIDGAVYNWSKTLYINAIDITIEYYGTLERVDMEINATARSGVVGEHDWALYFMQPSASTFYKYSPAVKVGVVEITAVNITQSGLSVNISVLITNYDTIEKQIVVNATLFAEYYGIIDTAEIIQTVAPNNYLVYLFTFSIPESPDMPIYLYIKAANGTDVAEWQILTPVTPVGYGVIKMQHLDPSLTSITTYETLTEANASEPVYAYVAIINNMLISTPGHALFKLVLPETTNVSVIVTCESGVFETGDVVAVEINYTCVPTLEADINLYVGGTLVASWHVLDNATILTNVTAPDAPQGAETVVDVTAEVVAFERVYASGSDSFTVFNQGPTILLNSPPQGSTLNGTVTIDLAISDPAGVAWAIWRWDFETEWKNLSEPWDITVDTLKYPNGLARLIVRAADTKGFESEASFYFDIYNEVTEAAFFAQLQEIANMIGRWAFLPGIGAFVIAVIVVYTGMKIFRARPKPKQPAGPPVVVNVTVDKSFVEALHEFDAKRRGGRRGSRR